MISIAERTGLVPLRGNAATRPGYEIEKATEWGAVADAWHGSGTPFQHALWLGAWYGTLGDRAGLSPLLLTAREAATGQVAIRLPLVVRRREHRRIIEFADLELTDYNAPLLGPAAPVDAAVADTLWRGVRRALPKADLLRLAKMPVMVGDRPNPLALLPGALPCAENGNVVRTGDDYDGWRRSLEKTVRKELERSWRVFRREPDTRFEIVTDAKRASAIVAAMEVQQETRMRAKGVDYGLDDPDIVRFYRDLVDTGLSSGFAVLTALTAGEEVVASLLGVRDANSYVMIRISNAAGRWTNCSPGRLIIERTMAALHAEGCRAFDFSIGNYDYKRRLGVEPLPLVDLTEARGLAGLPASLRAKAAGGLRHYPALDRRVRTVAGRLIRARG